MSQQDRLNTEPPRSRAPMIIGVVIAIIAIIAATVAVTGALDKTAPSTSTTPSTPEEQSTSAAAAGGDGAGAQGCLGGVNPTKAVLAAQKEADLDAQGAAGFAATVMRWRSQFPVDPAYAGKAKQLMTPDAGSDLLTVDPPKSGSEDSGWGSTDGARYRVTESTKSTATVEISMPFFATSKEYPDGVELTTAARWRLSATGDKWQVADMDALEEGDSSRTDVEAHGMTFEGVC